MRIYDSKNRPMDFCDLCAPTLSQAREDFAHLGDGPDDRGNCFAYAADHPDYNDAPYYCHDCRIELVAPMHSSWIASVTNPEPEVNATF